MILVLVEDFSHMILVKGITYTENDREVGAYAIVRWYLRKTARRINDTGYRDITKGRARTKMAESYLPDRQR